MSILELTNVSYAYSGATNQVLRGVNASFDQGKLYAVMGRSGAGKSTLLSLISGLDRASSGMVSYDGHDLAKMDRDDYRARSIGVIFQGYNLLGNATAIDNVVLSMNISGVKGGDKRRKALELLEQVGIDAETANRVILKLSGGEQQRVGIARALAHDPAVIIADEPTGNLDYDTEKQILEIFADLAHEHNKCVILVTHSKKVAAATDEIWGLNHATLTFVKENARRNWSK
jgi:putative ABC transport system ATP-binding protein